MKLRSFYPILTILIIVFVGVAIYYLSSDRERGKIEVGEYVDSLTGGESVIIDDSTHGLYVDYSDDYLQKFFGKTKVLFFYASWCGNCKILDKEIVKNLASVPGNTVIVKVDYDKFGSLASKYGVTSEGSIVLVDDSGALVRKWAGATTLKDLLEKSVF